MTKRRISDLPSKVEARRASPSATADPADQSILAPMGNGHELRMVFPAVGSTWGVACLLRDGRTMAFSDQEVAFAERAATTVGVALRRAVTNDPEFAHGHDAQAPLVMLDRDGRLTSASTAGLSLLQDVAGVDGAVGDPAPRMPFAVQQILARARAVDAGTDLGPARTRLRTRSGRWLVVEASCLRNARLRVEHIVLAIRPVGPSDIAPLLAASYDLSVRERQIAQLVARGTSTGEMASLLFISVHTVRDHLKAIFEKVGVTSRGELVAMLFATHYFPTLHDGMAHPADDLTRSSA